MRCDPSSLQSRVAAGVSSLSEREWTACYPHEVEGWSYYRACEADPPSGVHLAAVEIRDGAGLVAAAPLFELSYRLDTPLQGRLRGLADAIASRFPNLLEWRLLGVGSPFADRCHIALRPGLAPSRQALATQRLIDEVETVAHCVGAALITYKDLVGDTHEDLAEALGRNGYAEIRSLPIAVLELDHSDGEAYVQGLSPAMRKDIRRKLRSAHQIRVERRTEIDTIAGRIEALYRSTCANSAVRYGAFEELPANYFAALSRGLGDRAVFVLYWIGEELAAFNLLLLEPDRVIDKFLGMAYPLAREHNLYVVSWMENVRFCIETGRRVLQSGQTAYASKLRLGSRLVSSRNFVRHRNPIINRAIGLAAPLFAFDRWDPDLKRLKPMGRLP